MWLGTPALSILLAISVIINIFFLMLRRSGGFAETLGRFLADASSGRTDLTLSLSPERNERGVLGQISSSLNEFVKPLREIFLKLSAIGLKLTMTSDAMKKSSTEMHDMSEKTSLQTTQVATAMEEMSSTINEISQNTSRVAELGAAAAQNAQRAEKDIAENIKGIGILSERVAHWAETNRELLLATEKINEIVVVIKDIADQTNLLALNAAIEAARAGEQGRGFAVVADEVRKLADKTGKATREIADMIQETKEKGDTSLQTMDSALSGVTESIARAGNAGQSISSIVSEVKQMADMVTQIAIAAEEQSKVAEDVLSNMTTVSSYASRAKELASNISTSGDAIASYAMGLYSQLCSVKKSALDEKIEEYLKSFTAELQGMIGEAVKGGRLDSAALFDENYVNKADGKLTTRFTRYFEDAVLPVLKRWATTDSHMIYVVVMDRNGYMPTHLLPARAGIKMEDPVSLNGARSSKIIGQGFRRPIQAGGELVEDIAAPVTILDRHWGCLRIGYIDEV
ncbi:MAG: methyl-accepting chemotaxis protein [Thermodesulfovibrionales bacterium]|jgi:methyl-accepting chemotaxis protein